MSIVDKLASQQGRRDEEPNIALAESISAKRDTQAVEELVTAMSGKDKAMRHDCIKVLYEIGERRPDLIASYIDDFVRLLGLKDNRMVWGGMTALGQVVSSVPAQLWEHIDAIIATTEHGSAITQDWGIRVLAHLFAADPNYEAKVFPFLIDFLSSCRPKDLPRHTESTLTAIHSGNRDQLLRVLEKRLGSLRPSPAKRVQKAIKAINALPES